MVEHNLPTFPTPFVGREQEIADLAERLDDPHCRLLTLVGPGGIGKTRLAVAVGHDKQNVFSDSVYFVPLQPLSAPEQITLAIAQTLQYQLAGGAEPTDQLFRYLKNKRLCLILDNFDHLLAGAAMISSLLANAPRVVILITSRERLNLLEEWVYEVPGLRQDDSNRHKADAVQLFFQTAQRARPGFSLDDEYQRVDKICHLVEGMPLAIELAASWVQRLPLQAILEEIEAGLNIFESRARNIPERHRNMRATFDYSWRLLREAEQDVFKRLSVFRGGFRLEAAQAVAGATQWELATLVDKSMLRVDASGRYDLHELVRQYGEEALATSTDEREHIHNLHCRFYLKLTAKSSKNHRGARLKQALTEIAPDIDNIRVAWAWAIPRVRTFHTLMDESMDVLRDYYDTNCWYQEMDQVFRNVIEALDAEGLSSEKPIITARVRARLYLVGWNGDHIEEAKYQLRHSLEIFRQEEALDDVAYCLLRLAEVNYLANTLREGQNYLEESLSTFTIIGDTYGRAQALGYLGFWHHSYHDQERARQLLEESVALFEPLDDSLGEVLILSELTAVLIELGEYETAQYYAEKCLQLSMALGFKHGTTGALALLAEIVCELGQPGMSLQYGHQALQLSLETRRMHLISSALIACAHILVNQGKYAEALELFALTRQHPSTLGDGQVSIERGLTRVKPNVSTTQFEAALVQGEKLELEPTAQALLDEWDQRMTPSVDQTENVLTGRERDVLRLVAAGMTNPQIAAELIFTVGTVKWYLHQIYTKLNVGNRTQAVVRARELNLLS